MNHSSESLPTASGHALLKDTIAYARFKSDRQDFYSACAQFTNGPTHGVFFGTRSRSKGANIEMDGRALVSFSSYDYLGFSQNRRVIGAATSAMQNYGFSASASRVAGGQTAIHQQLDSRIAQFLGVDAALTFNGGYLTSASTIGHLLGPNDLILHDANMHQSALEGIRTSGAARRSFAHNDVASLRGKLEAGSGKYRKTLVCVEGVYSMDGDVCPLAQIVALKKEFEFSLLVDEAHSLGVIGATGRGIAEHAGVDRSSVDLWMGTLSKSLASCGGYIAGSGELIEYLRYTCPGFVYSAAMPPASAAAAHEALVLLQEDSNHVLALRRRIEQALVLVAQLGLDVGVAGASAVVPVIVGSSEAALALSSEMMHRGYCVHPLWYPAVGQGQARLRFFITANHSAQDVADALTAVAQATEEFRSRMQPASGAIAADAATDPTAR